MKYPFFYGGAWRAVKRGDALIWWPETSGLFFRIYGYGLHISTQKRRAALFSERYGHKKTLYLFGLRFQALKP